VCGLVGIFHLREPVVINRDLLSRMNELQFHRGPDEGGLHVEPGVGLGLIWPLGSNRFSMKINLSLLYITVRFIIFLNLLKN